MLHSSWRTSLSCSSMAKKIRYNLNKLGKQIVTPEADWFLYISIVQCYVSVKSKLQHAPPSGIPRAFDTFAVPGRREFDYQSLPGGGEFDPQALGVGNLNCTLDFM